MADRRAPLPLGDRRSPTRDIPLSPLTQSVRSLGLGSPTAPAPLTAAAPLEPAGSFPPPLMEDSTEGRPDLAKYRPKPLSSRRQLNFCAVEDKPPRSPSDRPNTIPELLVAGQRSSLTGADLILLQSSTDNPPRRLVKVRTTEGRMPASSSEPNSPVFQTDTLLNMPSPRATPTPFAPAAAATAAPKPHNSRVDLDPEDLGEITLPDRRKIARVATPSPANTENSIDYASPTTLLHEQPAPVRTPMRQRRASMVEIRSPSPMLVDPVHGQVPPVLPLVNPSDKNPHLHHVDPRTLAALLSRDIALHTGARDSVWHTLPVVVIDCRYPYEFEGGHINHARNLFTPEMIDLFFFGPCAIFAPNTVFIFHCEFSSARAPALLQYLRDSDRRRFHDAAGYDATPVLKYPQLFLISGGYKNFFGQYPSFCSPSAYLPMEHPEWSHELSRYKFGKRHLRRTQTWNGTSP